MITTRPLTPADAPALAALQSASAAELMASGQHPPEFPLKPWDAAKAERWIGKDIAVGAFDSGALIVAWIASMDGRRCLAEWYLVLPSLTRKRQADASLQLAKERVVPALRAAGAASVYGVVSANLAAHMKLLYVKFGWTSTPKEGDSRFVVWSATVDAYEATVNAL